MSKATLTPYDSGEATRTGPKLWRKQVLKKGSISYKGRRIAFDDAYLTDLAQSFRQGAYDAVHFQLADGRNTHTLDPERTRGTVHGFEVTPDGLDMLVELSEDGQRVVESNPRLGVSARIVEGLNRADGKSFKRAIHHVLGTIDPRVTGLRPWQVVELSNDETTDEVLDLTACSYDQGGVMPTIDVSDEQLDVLNAVLAQAGAGQVNLANEDTADTSPADGDDTGTDTSDEPDMSGGQDDTDGDEPPVESLTDEELDAILAEAERDANLSLADLANELEDDDTDDYESVDLANARDETRAARTETAEARYKLAARDLIDAGVPPSAVDLARPVLEQTEEAVIELSNAEGDPVDVRGIVTGLLDELKGTVDLAREQGRSHHDESNRENTDLESRWSAYLENN